MKKLSATFAALAVVIATSVALPAAASTGTTNGGTSATPPAQQEQGTNDPRARTASYKPVTATWYGPGLYGNHLACGGRLRHSTIGVAHKTLACGTKVAL